MLIEEYSSSTDDLDALLTGGKHVGYYHTSGSTVNTPYNQGLTLAQEALVFSYANDVGYGHQIIYHYGSANQFIRYYNNYVIGEWEKINNGVTMDLLWENASPTSGFATQDINLDLSIYKGIYLCIKVNKSFNSFVPFIILGKNLSTFISYVGTGSAELKDSGSVVYLARLIMISDSKVNIGNCYMAYNSAVYSMDNNYAIPYTIYGIK